MSALRLIVISYSEGGIKINYISEQRAWENVYV